MRHSVLFTAVLSALSFAHVAQAEEAKSPWAVTTNVGFVSDYYARGISQTWHKPAVQGGLDITHSSGFFGGVWGSNVSPNTYPDATAEVDVYGGYNGSVPWVEGLGYTVGLIGYIYPGGSWKKYTITGSTPAGIKQTPQGDRWDTYEANFGLSYGWLSGKVSVTLSDWYGAERKTGWDGSTKGTTYVELNANYPLPWWGLTLVGHVGQLNVAGMLDTRYTAINGQNPSTSLTMASSPDNTDYKVGFSKAFSIANSEGWNAGLYYVGASNREYWGDRGYGGTSFNGSTQTKDLNEGRVVVSVSRVF